MDYIVTNGANKYILCLTPHIPKSIRTEKMATKESAAARGVKKVSIDHMIKDPITVSFAKPNVFIRTPNGELPMNMPPRTRLCSNWSQLYLGPCYIKTMI